MTKTLLRNALRANALFSTVCALGILTFTSELSVLFASFPAIALQSLAVGLVGFSIFLIAISRQKTVNIGMVKAITYMDWAWVAGSALLIAYAFDSLSLAAIDLIAGVALAVGACAYYQGKGLRQLQQQATPNLSASEQVG